MKREHIEIGKRLYDIWKDGFDSEYLNQYDFNDDVVYLTEDVESLESYTSAIELKLKIAEEALEFIRDYEVETITGCSTIQKRARNALSVIKEE